MAAEQHSPAEHLQHTPVEIFGVTIHLDTVIMAGISIGLLFLFIYGATRNLTEGVPRGLQNLMEIIVEFIEGMVKQNLPVYLPWMTPLALTLFLYILFANLLGEIPGMKAPTADLNIPVGLAIISFILFVWIGFRQKGFKGYSSEFLFHPFGKWLVPVNVLMKVLEELAKPTSLALRLFGNMLAGEVMIVVIAILLPWYLNWTGGVLWLAFHGAVCVIQAFIFTVLTVMYVAIAQQESEHH